MFFSVARYNFTVGRTIRRLSEGIFGSAFSCGSLALLMPGVVFLRGERVTLRTIEEEDAEILQRAYNEPAFQGGILFRYPTNQLAIETLIEETTEDDTDDFHLLICTDEQPVGYVSLFDIRLPGSATLSYWVLPEDRGEGYATKGAALVIDHAFRTIGLHRIFAWTIDYNEASQALLRRLGFTHEDPP